MTHLPATSTAAKPSSSEIAIIHIPLTFFIGSSLVLHSIQIRRVGVVTKGVKSKRHDFFLI
jgi:hypothetical protein